MNLPTISASIFLLLTASARGFAPVSLPCSPIATVSTIAASSSYSKLAATGADNDALLDALTQTVAAANQAASSSSDIAQSLYSATSSAPLMTSEAITTAQSNLEILQQNLLTSTDPQTLSNALHEALQTSIIAADHALSSTSVLSYNLAHFDAVLATSMHNAHPFASIMTPEMAEISQAKLALLLHNLSGVHVDDNFLSNFMSHVDSRLDGLEGTGGDSSIVLFGAAAVVMAYSQREVGVANYKMELRKKIEMGEFDIDELVKEVASSGAETIEAPVAATNAMFSEFTSIDEDLAIDTAADALPLIQVTGAGGEKADEPELIMATAAVTEPEAEPKPPAEDIPIEALLKQVEEVALNTMASVVDQVSDKKIVEPSKKPASSPLARLLAQELNLNLIDIGKGTGKNGKILIEDVRKFHAKLEEARTSIATSRAYFASVSA